jgi:hypothetical protein
MHSVLPLQHNERAKRSGYWSAATITDNEQEADSAMVAIRENNKHVQGPTVPTWPSVGTNYRSGSAIVATTGSGAKQESTVSI